IPAPEARIRRPDARAAELSLREAGQPGRGACGRTAVTALPINSDAEWRQHRKRHVGGSEVAALFGEHPHLTKFELWHRKAGSLPDPDLSDNERVFWGQTLEPA